jgi:hypothetical protein
MGKGGKKNDGAENSRMIYLIYCKNFCTCHIHPSTNIKKYCGWADREKVNWELGGCSSSWQLGSIKWGGSEERGGEEIV